jgi:PAS domain S-box-containing protein
MVIAMVEDITEKNKAEEEVANAKERLRLAIDSGSVGGWDFDLKNDTSVWFGKAHAQLGIAEGSSASRQAFWDHVHEDDREHLWHALRVARDKHEEFAEEFRVVWSDGTTRWLRSRGRYQYTANGEPHRTLGISIDITESKEAEQALRESEERFRLAAETGRMYSFDWDATTDIVVRSTERIKILGATEPLRFSHAKFAETIHPEDRPRFLAAIADLTPVNPTAEVIYRVPAPDGTLVWLKSIGRGFFDNEGRLLRVIGMVADISDQKRSEEALRASEERLRLAQQAARIGTFERDVRTGRITWTEGLASLYGLATGSLEGKTIAFFKDLIHPDDFEQAVDKIERALKTGEPSECEWRSIWPDGSIHWIESRWRVSMDESGKPLRVFGLNMDVTERKQAEQALHAQEELLKIFVKNVPASVAMLDRDMRYLQVSDRWCTDYLTGRAEILGHSHYELFKDMPERWKEVHRRALAGETLRADEDHWVGQDGSHWARWEVHPWTAVDGTVGGILILAEDVTRRKQMEQTLLGMTRKLVEAQEQERARIGRELHDDITQRLALLAIQLQRLDENPSDIQNRAQELSREAIEISNDVQALSHELHASKLEYLGVVAGMRSWCREFGERQGMEINFTTDVASRIPSEIGLTLFRISQEALHNAIKHSGVKRIDVQLSEHSNEIHLTISDAGKGFDTEAVKEGRGLGLASMEERVRLVKGTIAIESKPMGGTTIHVRVPFEVGHEPQRAAG